MRPQPPRAAVRSMLLILALVVASAAFAQTPVARARVKQDGTSIWRPGFLMVATVVSGGTQLDVLGRTGDWIEVYVPGARDEPRTRGFVAASAVELSGPVPESSPPPARGASASPQRPALPRRPFAGNGVRVFGTASQSWFAAQRSFDAIFGSSRGALFGGGAESQTRDGLFVQGAVEYFRRAGQRVFVFEGEVYPLGVRDVVTILPLSVTVGYRVPRGRVAPYGGGGVGRHFVRDNYETADAAARKFQSFTSYHAVGGVEWWASRRFGTAVEAQYTHVPDAMSNGVGAELGEDNLGGMQARVKVMFGR